MSLRSLVLAGVAVGCFALVAPAAQAKTCPSGQILRVSKNICMDKGEAVKLGILRGGVGKATSASKAKKAVAAKIETDEDEAPKAKTKPRIESRPDKSAKAAPEKIVDDPKPARAVEPPKINAKPVEAPEPVDKGRNVRVIPLSLPAAPASPAPAASQLAPLEPPKALTPSPFGSLGGGSPGAGALGAAPAFAGAPGGRK
jgi:outer membrane biosynthesis protein TonB